MSDYWSQYWQQGHLTSFGEDIKENYTGELKDAWQNIFCKLNEKDHVLDIGTGNGALIALALESSNVNCKFVGIDYAKLNIKNKALLDSEFVSFKENVSVESLPFEGGTFSKVISQFALEYTDLQKAIAEVSRVIQSGGRFQFVCHHENSTIVLPNNATLNATKEIMKSNGPYQLAKNLIELLTMKVNGSHDEKENIREKLNKEIAEIVGIDEEAFYATNFPKFLQGIFSKRSAEDKYTIIEQFGSEMKGLILRLDDLKRAALTEIRKNELLELCSKHGLSVETCSIVKQADDSILAYQIYGSKSLL